MANLLGGGGGAAFIRDNTGMFLIGPHLGNLSLPVMSTNLISCSKENLKHPFIWKQIWYFFPRPDGPNEKIGKTIKLICLA